VGGGLIDDDIPVGDARLIYTQSSATTTSRPPLDTIEGMVTISVVQKPLDGDNDQITVSISSK
jgi:hypothetical protein